MDVLKLMGIVALIANARLSRRAIKSLVMKLRRRRRGGGILLVNFFHLRHSLARSLVFKYTKYTIEEEEEVKSVTRRNGEVNEIFMVRAPPVNLFRDYKLGVQCRKEDGPSTTSCVVVVVVRKDRVYEYT